MVTKVTNDVLANNAVGANNIIDGSITSSKLAAGAWGGTETAAANGYVSFPSGIKFEWGSSASIAANTTGIVTFPSAFTTAVYSVVVTGTGTANLTATGTTTISNSNLTAFTIENGDDDARVFYWQAVGK